jgi:hypothetical protein
MACFSCSKEKDLNTVAILLRYKEAFEITGKIFWFFKKDGSNEINIMNDEDFKKFRSENKTAFSQGEYEFSRIDEFRVT